jgi:(4-(4-[2-(gamma-L-glutamylamino)ethyl]phenoxymethyl)furan-2-yl)methanamine synthase
MPSPEVFGWDVGGAHVKVCRTRAGEVLDVMQWPCPLWQGLEHLDHVLAQAQQRWPLLRQQTPVWHAVTMTGEMVDLFEHREDGVARLAAHLAERLAPGTLRFFAGDLGWCGAENVSRHWQGIASANWLATARHVAQLHGGAGVLVDIGSTTTDLIAFRDGQVLTQARSDVDRLASGELVYQGVVRTPLCALAQRITWRGRPLNVMNEFFATTADVYRLTDELDPLHDQHAPADNAGKDLPATRRRLARMVGLDARDGSEAEWLAFAQAWRACQVQEIAGQLQRVLALHRLPRTARLVSAGCGDFLVAELATLAGVDHGLSYGRQVARLEPGRHELAVWAQVCAPCIAVAALWTTPPPQPREADRCGS